MLVDVTVTLRVVANDTEDATAYVDQTLTDIAERDMEGPGSLGVTEEPWLLCYSGDMQVKEGTTRG